MKIVKFQIVTIVTRLTKKNKVICAKFKKIWDYLTF